VVSILATVFWSFVLITVLLEFRPSFKYATLVVFAEIFQLTYMCIWTGSADSAKNIIQLYYFWFGWVSTINGLIVLIMAFAYSNAKSKLEWVENATGDNADENDGSDC